MLVEILILNRIRSKDEKVEPECSTSLIPKAAIGHDPESVLLQSSYSVSVKCTLILLSHLCFPSTVSVFQ
jgi:hypothetical protein